NENGSGLKKDENGQLILTKLDEETLKKVALATGGSYVRSITGDLDLDKIYQDILDKTERKELKSGMQRRFIERFQIFLLLGFVFLLLEFMMRPKSTQRLLQLFKRPSKKGTAKLAIFLFMLLTS